MKNVLEELFYNNIKENVNSEYVINLEKEIEMNKTRLKENLTKKQKKLLLRVEDGKDLINEICNSENFMAGFKIGLKVGFEVNKE